MRPSCIAERDWKTPYTGQPVGVADKACRSLTMAVLIDTKCQATTMSQAAMETSVKVAVCQTIITCYTSPHSIRCLYHFLSLALPVSRYPSVHVSPGPLSAHLNLFYGL
jgi:hypothetical protein